MRGVDGASSYSKSFSTTLKGFRQYALPGASQVAQIIKNLPANARGAGDVGSTLGHEDPLEEEMATRFSMLAWRIPRTEEPGGT